MKRKVFAAACLALISGFVFADDEPEVEILLPDLTTVITGSEKAYQNRNEIDVSENIIIPAGSGIVTPVLPDVKLEREEKDLIVDIHSSEKNVFAEGKIGAGLPGYFTGEFSLYRVTGTSPFKLYFMSDNCYGYGGKSLSSGFNDTNTNILAEKTISRNNMKWKFGGQYQAFGNGLQGKSIEISSVQHRIYNSRGEFQWTLPKGFLFDTSMDFNGYIRFADVIPGGVDVNSWIEHIGLISFSPAAGIYWNSNAGFFAGIKGSWNLDSAGKNDYTGPAVHNRGFIGLDLGWKNDYVKVFGNAGFVAATGLVETKKTVPFCIGVNAEIPVHYSEKKMKISAEGGLTSFGNKVSELETRFGFAAFNFFPEETSDWYTNAKVIMSLKKNFDINFEFDFRKTAFGNGIWEADYCGSLVNDCYGFTEIERTQFMSNLNLSYNYRIFSISGGWLSYWTFVPTDCNRHGISLKAGFESEVKRWGAFADIELGIITDDFVPVLNLDAYYKITDQISIACEVTDGIKLISRTLRVKAGQYAGRSGTASLLVKFNF